LPIASCADSAPVRSPSIALRAVWPKNSASLCRARLSPLTVDYSGRETLDSGALVIGRGGTGNPQIVGDGPFNVARIDQRNLLLKCRDQRGNRIAFGTHPNSRRIRLRQDSGRAGRRFGRAAKIVKREALRMTPAMALGIADHIWTIGELVQTALAELDRPEAGSTSYRPFTVIDGGRSTPN
jgi:hypothetical protein